MKCPGCQRDNRPVRRYCGGCGCNFAPACSGCGFANERADRFCGGCGVAMRAGAARPEVPAAQPAIAAAAIAPAAGATPWAADELATLFAPIAAAAVEAPDLPDVGIGQDDVDRLFGSPS